MLIGNKLFPYPTLNNNQDLSQYKETSSFQLLFDTDQGELIKTQSEIILKNIRFQLKNKGLEALYTSRKIDCAVIVECSASAFRRRYQLFDTPKDIKIQIGDLSGNVSISAYMYAVENILGYSNPEFVDDYAEYTFNIERYDILAIDDGYRFNIDLNPEADNKVPSIFTIVKQNDAGSQMRCHSTANRINICLSPDYYADYDNIKNSPEYNNIMFAILAIPALTSCIHEIRNNINEYGDIDDILETKKWFKAVMTAYKRETSKNLTLDDLIEIEPVVLSQIVLNSATCNGLRDFGNFIIRGSGASIGGDDTDE